MSRPLLTDPLKLATTLPAVGQLQSTRSSAPSGSGLASGAGSTFATGGASGLGAVVATGGGASGFAGAAARAASLRCNAARFSSE